MSSQSGFTVAELLIAMASFALIAGAAFTLLDVGLDSYAVADAGYDDGASLTRAFAALRGEVAAARSLLHVSTDSLLFEQPDGSDAGYVVHAAADGLRLYRITENGAGFDLSPSTPLATLDGAIGFAQPAAGRLRVDLSSERLDSSFDVAIWSQPAPGPAPATMTICHKGKTKQIFAGAWAQHQAHGDALGSCP